MKFDLETTFGLHHSAIARGIRLDDFLIITGEGSIRPLVKPALGKASVGTGHLRPRRLMVKKMAFAIDFRGIRMMIAVNENRFFESAGDVTIYANASALAVQLEAIDVLNGEYFAIREDGRKMKFAVIGEDIIITEAEEVSSCIMVLRTWLGIQGSQDHIEYMRANAVSAGRSSGEMVPKLFFAILIILALFAYYGLLLRL